MVEKLKHLSEFDGVRGIAALMVMFFHFFQHLEISTDTLFAWVRKFSFFGQTGVTLFFVLSGFLITRILLNTKNSGNYFKVFFIRRSLRILPLYYLFLIIYYCGFPFIFEGYDVPFYKQWTFWVYLQDFHITFNWPNDGPVHYWSLAVEEHFYLFWPVVVYYFSGRNLVKAIYVMVAISVLLRAILFANGYEVFFFTFTNFDSLALGGLLAIQEFKKESNPLSGKKFIRMFLICLIPMLTMWFLMSGLAISVVQWFKGLFISIIYYSMLGYLLTTSGENNTVNKILKTRFLEFTGKISYGLYVYHLLCFSIMDWNFKFNSVLLNLILGFLVTYAIAALSYYLFEIHFLKLKKYFNY